MFFLTLRVLFLLHLGAICSSVCVYSVQVCQGLIGVSGGSVSFNIQAYKPTAEVTELPTCQDLKQLGEKELLLLMTKTYVANRVRCSNCEISAAADRQRCQVQWNGELKIRECWSKPTVCYAKNGLLYKEDCKCDPLMVTINNLITQANRYECISTWKILATTRKKKEWKEKTLSKVEGSKITCKTHTKN